jgi:hypothetical protein
MRRILPAFILATAAYFMPAAALAQTAPAPTSAAAPAAEESVGAESAAAVPAPAPAAAPAVKGPPVLMPLPRGAVAADGTLAPVAPLAARSMLFTEAEITAIVTTLAGATRAAARRAARGEDAVVPGTDVVIPGLPGYLPPEEEETPVVYPPIPTKRTIALSGVVYRGAADWIVWLNGHKLTPGRLIPEIADIRVERDRVHLKWFDIGMGKVIAITLRPRQVYDITSGVLLTTGGAAP